MADKHDEGQTMAQSIAMAGKSVAEHLPRTAAKQLFEILSLFSLRWDTVVPEQVRTREEILKFYNIAN